jgi:hypothetical protein
MNPEFVSDSYQVNQRSSTHLATQLAAKYLYRGFARADPLRNLFVQQPGHHKGQDFLFAPRESVSSLSEQLQICLVSPPNPVSFECEVHGIEQILIAEWLWQELNSARFNGADRHGNITMGCHEDDRDFIALPFEMALKIQSTHPR